MQCAKCQGLLLIEQHTDLGRNVYVTRCANCGWAKTRIMKEESQREHIPSAREISNRLSPLRSRKRNTTIARKRGQNGSVQTLG